jgi:hypothetical protein
VRTQPFLRVGSCSSSPLGHNRYCTTLRVLLTDAVLKGEEVNQ